jgi:hypothetical protein
LTEPAKATTASSEADPNAALAVLSSVTHAADPTAAAVPRDSVHLTPSAMNVLKRLDRLLKKEHERLEGMFAQFDNNNGYLLEKDLVSSYLVMIKRLKK